MPAEETAQQLAPITMGVLTLKAIELVTSHYWMIVRRVNIKTVFQCSKYDEYLPEIREQMEGAETPDLRLEEESMCQDFHLKKNWREG